MAPASAGRSNSLAPCAYLPRKLNTTRKRRVPKKLSTSACSSATLVLGNARPPHFSATTRERLLCPSILLTSLPLDTWKCATIFVGSTLSLVTFAPSSSLHAPWSPTSLANKLSGRPTSAMLSAPSVFNRLPCPCLLFNISSADFSLELGPPRMDSRGGDTSCFS